MLTLILLYGFAIAAIWLDGVTTGYEKSEYAAVLWQSSLPFRRIFLWEKYCINSMEMPKRH